MLLYMVGKAERALEKCHKEQHGDPYLAECEQNLARQYQKFFFMDNFNSMIKDAKDGEPETHLVMTDKQITGNNELKAAESARRGPRRRATVSAVIFGRPFLSANVSATVSAVLFGSILALNRALRVVVWGR